MHTASFSYLFQALKNNMDLYTDVTMVANSWSTDSTQPYMRTLLEILPSLLWEIKKDLWLPVAI